MEVGPYEGQIRAIRFIRLMRVPIVRVAGRLMRVPIVRVAGRRA